MTLGKKMFRDRRGIRIYIGDNEPRSDLDKRFSMLLAEKAGTASDQSNSAIGAEAGKC